MDTKQEIEKMEEGEARRIVSDVMIVRMGEEDYYVSEKIKGRAVYRKLLLERSKRSDHFPSRAEARIAAVELRARILSRNPDCEIVEIDVEEYPQREKPLLGVFRDEEGRILFGVTQERKFDFFFLSDEESYRLLDKSLYFRLIDEAIRSVDEEEDYYRREGLRDALCAAETRALPYLRFERYKAKEMLRSFEWDRELFECDIRYYEGYVRGTERAIEILKECRVTPSDWVVHVADRFGAFPEREPSFVCLTQIGYCEIVWHDDPAEIMGPIGPNERVLYFGEGSEDEAEFAREHRLRKGEFSLKKGRTRFGKKAREVLTTAICTAFFELSKGEEESRIPEEWIPALEEFKEREYASAIENGEIKIPQRVKEEAVRVISRLLEDPDSLTKEDVSVLKGIGSMCLHRTKCKNGDPVYVKFGSPSDSWLRTYLTEVKSLREDLLAGKREGLPVFIERYGERLKALFEALAEN